MPSLAIVVHSFAALFWFKFFLSFSLSRLVVFSFMCLFVVRKLLTTTTIYECIRINFESEMCSIVAISSQPLLRQSRIVRVWIECAMNLVEWCGCRNRTVRSSSPSVSLCVFVRQLCAGDSDCCVLNAERTTEFSLQQTMPKTIQIKSKLEWHSAYVRILVHRPILLENYTRSMWREKKRFFSASTEINTNMMHEILSPDADTAREKESAAHAQCTLRLFSVRMQVSVRSLAYPSIDGCIGQHWPLHRN